MTIDIIDLTDPKYADLNAVQLSMVRVAQIKKNGVEGRRTQDLRALREQLTLNGTERSTFLAPALAAIEAAADEEIEAIREDLLQQLAYESIGSEGNDNGPYRYPENPNYNLSYSQRFLVVRQYYMDITGDPDARFQAFSMDTLARSYLGEYYGTLASLLASYC